MGGVNGGFGGGGFQGGGGPGALAPAAPNAKPKSVTEFAKELEKKPDGLAKTRNSIEDDRLNRETAGGADRPADAKKLAEETQAKKGAFDEARRALEKRDKDSVQAGKLGVDLSLQTVRLRDQSRLELTAVRRVGNRSCLEIGGVWIDEGYTAKTPMVTVKAMSDAYFRILQRHPEVKEVFQLGNHLLWVTPSGTALVIDMNDGKDKLSDDEIDKLFVATK